MSSWLPWALGAGVLVAASSRSPRSPAPREGGNCLDELRRYLEGTASSGGDVDPSVVAGIIGGCASGDRDVSGILDLLGRWAPALAGNPYVMAALALLDPSTRDAIVEEATDIGMDVGRLIYGDEVVADIGEGPCLPMPVPAKYYGRGRVGVDPDVAPYSLLELARWYRDVAAPRIDEINAGRRLWCADAMGKERDRFACRLGVVDFGVVYWTPKRTAPTVTVGWHGFDPDRAALDWYPVGYSASPDDPPTMSECPDIIDTERGIYLNQSMFRDRDFGPSGVRRAWNSYRDNWTDRPTAGEFIDGREQTSVAYGLPPSTRWSDEDWGPEGCKPILGQAFVAWLEDRTRRLVGSEGVRTEAPTGIRLGPATPIPVR